MKIEVKNFRSIRHASVDLEDIALIVGPNASGKTSFLQALRFASMLIENPQSAIDNIGGPSSFAWDVKDHTNTIKIINAPTELEFETHITGQEASLYVQLYLEQKKTLPESLNKPKEITEIIQNTAPQIFQRIINFDPKLTWPIDHLRYNGSQQSSSITLERNGINAFTVLRNWANDRPHKEKYNFVLDSLREAFPTSFDEIGFEHTSQIVTIKTYKPGSNFFTPIQFESNGFLLALLHLTALCSTPDGGLLAIDEFENGLHPHAIRALIGAMREWAQAHDIKIILTTHSPVLINIFKDEPHKIHLTDVTNGLIRPMTETHNPEWIQMFEIGNLYGSLFAEQDK